MAASFPTSQAIVVGGGLGGRGAMLSLGHSWGYETKKQSQGGMKPTCHHDIILLFCCTCFFFYDLYDYDSSLVSPALSRHVGRQHCGGERRTRGVASRILRIYCELVQKSAEVSNMGFNHHVPHDFC